MAEITMLHKLLDLTGHNISIGHKRMAVRNSNKILHLGELGAVCGITGEVRLLHRVVFQIEEFILRTEEDIRRLGQGRLLISSSHGIQFQVPDRFALDRQSKKLLERFL